MTMMMLLLLWWLRMIFGHLQSFWTSLQWLKLLLTGQLLVQHIQPAHTHTHTFLQVVKAAHPKIYRAKSADDFKNPANKLQRRKHNKMTIFVTRVVWQLFIKACLQIKQVPVTTAHCSISRNMRCIQIPTNAMMHHQLKPICQRATETSKDLWETKGVIPAPQSARHRHALVRVFERRSFVCSTSPH